MEAQFVVALGKLSSLLQQHFVTYRTRPTKRSGRIGEEQFDGKVGVVHFPGLLLVRIVKDVPPQVQPVIFDEACVEPEVKWTVFVSFWHRGTLAGELKFHVSLDNWKVDGYNFQYISLWTVVGLTVHLASKVHIKHL